MIYLDYCSTTPLHNLVIEKMRKIDGEVFGNPSSIHQFGQKAKAIIESSRKDIASIFDCSSNEIIFTSSGTEANNLVLWDVFQKGGKHIIISDIEHPCISKTCSILEKFGVKISKIPVNKNGIIRISELKKSINKNTSLVSIMSVNNEIGTIQPIEEIIEICNHNKILFHTDAIQAFGKIDLNYKKYKPHMASFSAHKIYGPKGVGALYIKKGIKLNPLIYGGSQEMQVRAGTENLSGIAGFAVASKLANENLKNNSIKLNELSNKLKKAIFLNIDNAKILCNHSDQIPGFISLKLSGVNANDLLIKLDIDGFGISTGAACSSGVNKTSSVLKAIGLDAKSASSVIRISLGKYTKETDLISFVDSLSKNVKIIRNEKK